MGVTVQEAPGLLLNRDTVQPQAKPAGTMPRRFQLPLTMLSLEIPPPLAFPVAWRHIAVSSASFHFQRTFITEGRGATEGPPKLGKSPHGGTVTGKRGSSLLRLEETLGIPFYVGTLVAELSLLQKVLCT